VNLPSLGGAMGLYPAEMAWFPAIYVAFNVTANLTLVKARAQFGIPLTTNSLLIAYAIAVLFQLAFPSVAASLALRALCGVAMAALTTVTLYNLVQVFPKPRRPLAFLVGISIPQLGLALARLVPVEALAVDQWRGLHLIELGLICTVLAVTTALPIPPSDQAKVFEKLDAVTIALLIPAAVLICGVLSVGRYVWWTDTPWVGWALVAAIPFSAAAILLEHFRSRPLIQTRWISTGEMLRFAVVGLLVRIALAEQTYGSVGLLSFSGLINDQLHLLFALVALAMAVGIVTAALVVRPERIIYIVMVAALIIALGAWLDTDVTNLSRPNQLYLSRRR
jgi:MFS family permease